MQVSNYFEYFEVSSYLRRTTQEPIVIAMGVPALYQLFREVYYEHLAGGLLEVCEADFF